MNKESNEIASFKEQLYTEKQRSQLLQEELDATNKGLLALTMELEEKNEEVQSITQQLWQMAKLATMGELAASIAHELNNPLATISLRIETLMGKIPVDDSMQQSLQIISREVERMATLVTDLLEFSRRNQRQPVLVDVCQEIEHVLKLIHYHFRRNKVIIKHKYSSPVPRLHADRQELQQLFLNLFTNACDAMPEGGTLTIGISTDPTNDSVVITLSDTGIGINQDDITKVMEPFFTTKPEGKGTGLGLSICRRIVQERHGGMISITSEGGKGTTVIIKLPVTD